MARAITAGELTTLRSDGQFSRLYLAIHKPNTVYTARVNQLFATTDSVAEITYDGGAGTLPNVLPGMTMYVGSSAGAYDLGMVRIRKAPTATVFYIGETSEIAWADNLYLTVMDEFGVWPRHVRIGDDVYMDYDIEYDGRSYPFPVMGSPAVAWLPTDDDVDVTFNSEGSWIPGGGLLDKAWSGSGQTGIGGDETNAVFNYDTPGHWWAGLTVNTHEDDNYAFTARPVFVFDDTHPPVTQFRLDRCGGSVERGGWEFAVTLWDEAALADVRDRVMVVLFARDYYAGVEGSLGPLTHRENVLAVGWIAGESIVQSPVAGTVSFDVKGPQHWLSQMDVFPTGIEDTQDAATAWTQIQNLTVDKVLAHLVQWRTTLGQACDVAALTGDTRRATALEAPTGTIWSQILLFCQPILAHVAFDRYARLYAEIEPNLIPSGDRSAIPVVMTLTGADWREQVDITRRPVPVTSRVNLSGVYTDSTRASLAYFSLSPGHVFKRHGVAQVLDRLLLSSQAQSNTLAGMALANFNALYNFDIRSAENNRFVDICPKQFIAVDLVGATPRETSYTGNVVIREVEYQFANGILLPTWRGVCETFADVAITDEMADNTPPGIPPIPWITPPPLPPPPTPVGDGPHLVVFHNSSGVWFTDEFHRTYPRWWSMNVGAPPEFEYILTTRGGMVFAFRGGSDAGSGIWAANLGGTFSHIVDIDWVKAFYPGSSFDCNIWCMGLNRYSGMITMLAGEFSRFGTQHFYAGTLSGMVKGAVLASALGYQPPTYGYGWWIYTYTDLIGSHKLERITANGMISDGIDKSVGNAIYSPYHVRAGAGANGYKYGGQYLYRIEDAGTTITEIAITPTILGSYHYLGADHTGQFLMASSATGAKRSTDYGYTWGTITVPDHSVWWPIVPYSFQWLTARYGSVYYTDDFGDVWTDKTGNLHDYTTGECHSIEAIP
jgi:hypothetical protein